MERCDRRGAFSFLHANSIEWRIFCPVRYSNGSGSSRRCSLWVLLTNSWRDRDATVIVMGTRRSSLRGLSVLFLDNRVCVRLTAGRASKREHASCRKLANFSTVSKPVPELLALAPFPCVHTLASCLTKQRLET